MPTHTTIPAPAGGAPDRTAALLAEARVRVRGVTFSDASAACPPAHLSDRALAAYLADAVARLRQALEDIANPMAYLRRTAEADGAVLNGMAPAVAASASTLQHIARAALAAPTPAAPGARGA